MADGAALLPAQGYNASYYENHKAAGLDYLDYGDWQRSYGRWIAQSLGLAGKYVLDVGCACGGIAAGLAEAGCLVSGIDLSAHMIQLGHEKWPDLTLFVCDACNLHLWRDNTFQFLHSSQVFEHFQPELVPFIFRELFRVTEPGGALFCVLGTAEVLERHGRTNKAHPDATHTCVRPLAWWADLAKTTGWDEARDVLTALREHPDNYFKLYDWDVLTLRKPSPQGIGRSCDDPKSVFSIILPSRGRPAYLRRLVDSFLSTAAAPDEVEFLVAYDLDDTTMKPDLFPECRMFGMERQDGTTAYFNKLWPHAKGTYFLVMNDDTEMITSHWDETIRSTMTPMSYGQTSPAGSVNNREPYSEFPVIGRDAAKKLGYLLPPYFKSWGADYYLFKVFEKAGLVIDLKRIVINHFRLNDDTHKQLKHDDRKLDPTDDAKKLTANPADPGVFSS